MCKILITAQVRFLFPPFLCIGRGDLHPSPSPSSLNEIFMNVESSSFEYLLDDAKEKFATELKEANIPPVLSSIMSTNDLPIEYKGIREYIGVVRHNLEQQAGGNLDQLQTICLDSICEVLIVLKFIGTFMGHDINASVIRYDKTGSPKISELASKGFGGFQQILDKKIKLFHELALKKVVQEEEDAYLASVMGGRPTKGR